MKKIFTIIIAVIFTASMFAQAPQLLSYQAVIRNSSNNLIVSSPVGIQISILQGSATGTAVYVETQTPITNANGLVSMQIGGGTVVLGNFATINWASGTYFIETQTDPTGGINYSITCTSQILSVPFALYANTADSIKGGVKEKEPAYNSSVAKGITASDTIKWNAKSNFSGTYSSLIGKPILEDSISNYAVLLTGNQTISGTKKFNSDLLANGITVGIGNGSVSSNTAIGSTALQANTTGSNNTAIGFGSLLNNITGSYNTAIGINALSLNTAGTHNTAIGYKALTESTDNANTAVGSEALENNTTGGDNTAVGASAMLNNSSGIWNMAIGVGALMNNLTGNSNTANGFNALALNHTGNINSAGFSGTLF